MESMNSIPYAGRTVTLSFYARAGANYSATSNALTYRVDTGTGTDQNLINGYTGGAATLSATATLTTTWQRFQATATLPTTTTEFGILFQETPTGTASTNDYYEVTGVQIDIGSVALPFRTYAATIQGELAACQRYLPATTPSDAIGYAYNNNATIYSINYPVTPRVAPTGITTSGSFNAYASNTAYAVTLSINTGGLTQGSVTASGITIGVGLGSRLTQNAAGTILWTGCEL
jgi:hypothetical protein